LAVDAASAAFKTWSQKSAYERSEYILKWHQLIDDNKEVLARIMTMEQGKPLKEALTEIKYSNDYVRWYAEEAKRIYGDLVPSSDPNKKIFVKKEPVGVVAAITPWNFPAAMITRKLAPAFAAGCTVVLKPSKDTPFTALKLVELAEKAGFPEGVINIVTGDSREIVGVWQNDSRVRKITFTGSTPVGKKLMKDAADTMKKVSLELGGHAPFIVTKHADIDKAVEGAIHSKFRNGGQACVATNRFYVQEEVAEEFTKKFVERTSQLVVGNGLEAKVDIGPLINESALLKVIEHIDDAVKKGGKVLTGGKRIMEEQGFYLEPTVINAITDDMLCMVEETFGPVAPIATFKDLDEVIDRANNSPFGIAAYVFTENINEGILLTGRLDYGVVGLDTGVPSTAEAPFGGYKESGLGREGGKYGIEDYLETKYISLGL
jgi:succinate-semialdehyde dehydrogenase / glutarate-semialdehyde dehydrogenase